MARGYLLLLGVHLAPQNLAVVLAASGRSYKEKDVAMALRTTYPNGSADFGQQSKAFGAHVAEEADESDDVEDITALLAGFDVIEAIEIL
eukprot:9475253-Pyramimonas_sp.AAC.1